MLVKVVIFYIGLGAVAYIVYRLTPYPKAK